MLRFLSIRHLAVIDRLELELGPGLTVLTGETGAGKSILVGAVGLLVGGRASADMVRTGEESASIEAIFDAADGREVLVRREISAQGRSRAFIDGALATSAALRDMAAGLVDLHGQHEHQILLDPASHLEVLDSFAGLDAERDAVGQAFADYQRLRTERDRRRSRQQESAARGEFVAFQLSELDRAAPQPQEDDELGATHQVLANADKLQRLCAEAYQSLYDGDQAALAALGSVWRKVGELATIDDRFAPHLVARDTIKPQLEDLADFLRTYAAGIDASPARLQEVEDRIAVLERLKKKHGPTLADVLAKAAALRQERDDIEGGSDRAGELEAAVARAGESFLFRATALSGRRREAAVTFAKNLERALADLAMARTRCEVRLTAAASEGEWTERGIDAGEFYLSPNPGEELRPLARIASGGELSRIMLALKTQASTDAPGKTLIFDEVDAGIGGAVADVVGLRLQKLARRFQVLCITHLPQIAAYGTAHFRIAKAVQKGRTSTRVERLPQAERHEELARMIGGNDISAAVRASAAEMLASRAGAKGEYKSKGESESRR